MSAGNKFLGITLSILINCLSNVSSRPVYQASDNMHKSKAPIPNLKANANDSFCFVAPYHNVGNIELSISNYGEYGAICLFPKGSSTGYMERGGYWFGGIRGGDTLVSMTEMPGYVQNHMDTRIPDEFMPDSSCEWGGVIQRSILRNSPYASGQAVSEQDYVSRFTDTFANTSLVPEDQYDNRPHKPLYISVDQRSYTWSTEYTQDFVLFDLNITNIGYEPIKQMYIGLWIYTWAGSQLRNYYEPFYTVCGYRRDFDALPGSCLFKDTINLFWHADNDGNPNINGVWDNISARSALGIRVLRPRMDEKTFNYNWNIFGSGDYEWGPRKTGMMTDPFRSFAPYFAEPAGDRDAYYMMSHPEFDYDQMFTAVSHTSEGFLPPPKPQVAFDFASGWHNQYLISFGPWDLMPGDSVPVTFAVIGGENFHVNPTDYANYFNPGNPLPYYNKLDFTNLATNARWAQAVFDTPGFDTDNNGYAGEFCWKYHWVVKENGDSVVADSFRYYYTGDGVPDFKTAAPPPPPILHVTTEYGKIIIRWNGQETENSVDYFTGERNFEGYKVYFAESPQKSQFSLLSSYDLDDFMVYQFDDLLRVWNRISQSMTRDTLQKLYGPDFRPENFPDEMHAFQNSAGKYFYFQPQDWNQSDLTNPHKIHKVYPMASKDDTTDVTKEGWKRYYEYEYVIDNLEPSKPYWVAVTTFNFGSLEYNLGVLESSPMTNAVKAYPLPSSDKVEDEGMKATVYPNPYRIDGGYARAGYENRDRSKSADWSRLIHFANLPAVCTIRIFTPTGDLVQTIEHNYPGGGPTSQHEQWNVISKNTQEVVTGIYIWEVSSAMGDQIGKLVIIK
jgi:hypothetical protein